MPDESTAIASAAIRGLRRAVQGCGYHDSDRSPKKALGSALRPQAVRLGPFSFPEKEEEMSAMALPTVLTVEDDPIARADLRLVLEDAGFAVSAARDGIEAVELARKTRPDAILLDLGLPRMDGIEVTRRILAAQVVPIVALTGRSMDLAHRAVEAGATSFVLKPFHPEEVVGALLDALALQGGPVQVARAESRRVIAEILGLLGYPEDWAIDFEAKSFRSGKVWKVAG
jgi:CheY-like chemotaxis protein